MKTSERLVNLINYYHVSIADFARKLGISTTKLYDIKRGQIKNFSAEISDKILQNCPEINHSWLLLGEGPMLKSETEANGNSGIVGNNNTISNSGTNSGTTITPDLQKLIEILKSQSQSLQTLTDTNKSQSDQISKLIDILSEKE